MTKTDLPTSMASTPSSSSTVSAPVVPMTSHMQPLQAATRMMPQNSVAPQQHIDSPPSMGSKSAHNSLANMASSSAVNLELLSAFECPVCMEYMLPPYLQCPNGHLMCGNCRPKVNQCPACRGAVPSIRNLAMERIANTLLFPCKFNSSGCPLNFSHTTKIEHEEHCDFRPYSCPCPGASCKWQGGLEDVMQHLIKMHKSITTLQGEDIVFLATDISLPGAVDWVMMQQCFGSYFMLVLEKQEITSQNNHTFYAIVQLIGTKLEADKFTYKLELMNGRRRLSWEATPRSIHEGVSSAISQSDCLSFDSNQAELFSENGNLGINVTIQRYN